MVNADLRGAGTSEGTADILSQREGEDVYDLIEWAAAQPWSTGRVGLLGVSYLAITQWRAAALRPPSLGAISPWEGFTDAYRDLLRPGGIPEVGFARLWAAGLRSVRQRGSFIDQQAEHPLRDDWWTSHVPDLTAIEVPALVCGSFSDNNLHSRGSFRGFDEISSVDKHLYTHRSGKWATFYTPAAGEAQLAFFDTYLRDAATPVLPRVRLEVRESRDVVSSVRSEPGWPPPSTPTRLHLSDAGLGLQPAPGAGHLGFDVRRRGARWAWTVPADVQIVGPITLHTWIETHDTDDVDLFVGVEKWRGARYVGFEGSYGFGRDRVATGWQRVSLRGVGTDPPAYDHPRPLAPGEIVPVTVELGPSATQFRAGEQLRLVIAGRWLWPRNPLTGQFPAAYRSLRRGRCSVHWGPETPSQLTIPALAEVTDQ